MPCDWGGNRRSGVALAMRHRLQWFIHLRVHGLRKGDEHPAYTHHGIWHSFTFLQLSWGPRMVYFGDRCPGRANILHFIYASDSDIDVNYNWRRCAVKWRTWRQTDKPQAAANNAPAMIDLTRRRHRSVCGPRPPTSRVEYAIARDRSIVAARSYQQAPEHWCPSESRILVPPGHLSPGCLPPHLFFLPQDVHSPSW